MSKKETKAVAAYLYPHFANKGKILKVLDVLKEYRNTANKIAKAHWRYFFSTKGGLNKNLKLTHIESKLSERYKQTCSYQVVSMIESYIENIQDRIRTLIWQTNLSNEDKLILSYINSYRGWYKFNEEEIKIKSNEETVKVQQWHRDFIKTLFRQVRKRNKKPCVRKISMHLDAKVFEIKPKDEGKAKTFDYWLSLATLEKRNRVLIPLKRNPYAEAQEGEFLNFIQISEKQGKILIRRAKQLHKKRYCPVVPVISIDIGLNPFIATDKGDLVGRKFFEFLSEIDRAVTLRMSYLQKNKIKPSQDKKYIKIVNRLRNFLKNEINRYLNRVIKAYKPARIVVERLDFRSPDLSRRMNRLIQNFGKKYFKDKLTRLRELYGVVVEEINPAYTSQTCSHCGYVARANRKNTQTFECKACGKKLNAQVNGARNILKRSSLKDIKLYTPKKKVLQILLKQYLERLTGCNSAPWKLLKNSCYLRDFLSNFEPWGVENKCL